MKPNAPDQNAHDTQSGVVSARDGSVSTPNPKHNSLTDQVVVSETICIY